MHTLSRLEQDMSRDAQSSQDRQFPPYMHKCGSAQLSEGLIMHHSSGYESEDTVMAL